MGDPHNPNNPAKVPPILAALDQPQEGLPRIIHPIALPVGRPDPTLRHSGGFNAMDQYADDIVIDEDATYVNAAGDPIQFRAGQRVSAASAAQFPDLAKQLGDKPVRGAGLARPIAEQEANRKADEEAAKATTSRRSQGAAKATTSRRSQGAAPQNKAEGGAPQTKREGA